MPIALDVNKSGADQHIRKLTRYPEGSTVLLGASGVLLASDNWAELVIWIGIPPNLYFAFPALFNRRSPSGRGTSGPASRQSGRVTPAC